MNTTLEEMTGISKITELGLMSEQRTQETFKFKSKFEECKTNNNNKISH